MCCRSTRLVCKVLLLLITLQYFLLKSKMNWVSKLLKCQQFCLFWRFSKIIKNDKFGEIVEKFHVEMHVNSKCASQTQNEKIWSILYRRNWTYPKECLSPAYHVFSSLFGSGTFYSFSTYCMKWLTTKLWKLVENEHKVPLPNKLEST